MRKRIRIERCYRCHKIIINKGISLHYDLYMKQMNCIYCKRCEKEKEKEKKKNYWFNIV